MIAARADRYRADLHQRGYGDGHYGFAIPVRLLSRPLSVKVIDVQPAIEITVGTHGQPSGSASEFAIGSYLLHIDDLGREGYLDGWAIDRSHPEIRRVLRLYGDGSLIGQQQATLFRQELADNVHDGYHGFRFGHTLGSSTSLELEDVGAGTRFPLQARK